MSFEKHFLENTIGVFNNYRALAEKSFDQLNHDKEFHYVPDAESNSIAIIMKHMAGNMISRWTDFLTTDGEKPNRNRDGEFIEGVESKEELNIFSESKNLNLPASKVINLVGPSGIILVTLKY